MIALSEQVSVVGRAGLYGSVKILLPSFVRLFFFLGGGGGGKSVTVVSSDRLKCGVSDCGKFQHRLTPLGVWNLKWLKLKSLWTWSSDYVEFSVALNYVHRDRRDC